MNTIRDMHTLPVKDKPDISNRLALLRKTVSGHRLDVVMLLGCVVAFSWLALTEGRDIPWDYYNYHAYSVLLLSHDRLAHDFLAAGLQGYFNPIGFIPLALTQHWHFDSMYTAVTLASLHSLNAFFLYLICRDLATGKPGTWKFAIGMGWLLGATTPVFLSHVGSTGVDPIGSVLVMAASWLAVFHRQPRHLLLAGLIAGIAIAIKLSNVGFALAIAVVIALPQRESMHEWSVRVGCGAIGMLGGFVLAQGWWSWRLQEATGNPFFPFFNSIFHSPYFTTESTGDLRFVPASLEDLVRQPYRLALAEPWTYLEVSAPTAVPLVACLVALALGALFLIRSLAHRPRLSVPGPGMRLYVLVAVATALWVATSSNGRYGIPLFMLLGPTLSMLCLMLLPQRHAALLLALLGALQVYTIGTIGVGRWNSSQWTPQLLSVDMPEQLKKSPQLFLSLTAPSHSEIIPYLHPDSAFVNVRGSYSIPSTGASHERLESLLTRYRNRTQVVFSIPVLDGLEPNAQAIVRNNNLRIDRLGLYMLPDRCSEIHIDHQRGLPTRFNKRLGAPTEFTLMSCDAVRVTPSTKLAILRARATRIMDAFEVKCPKLFLPSKPQIEGTGPGWVRKYSNLDSISLAVNFNKDMLFYSLSGQTSLTYIGKASDWKNVVAAFRCEVPGQGKRGIDFFNENEKDAIWS